MFSNEEELEEYKKNQKNLENLKKEAEKKLKL